MKKVKHLRDTTQGMAKDGPRVAVVKLSPDGQTKETPARFQGELKANQPTHSINITTVLFSAA